MTTYNFTAAVSGETATSNGLVAFEYKAGASIDDTDPMYPVLKDAGVLEEPKRSAKATAPAAADTPSEEN